MKCSDLDLPRPRVVQGPGIWHLASPWGWCSPTCLHRVPTSDSAFPLDHCGPGQLQPFHRHNLKSGLHTDFCKALLKAWYPAVMLPGSVSDNLCGTVSELIFSLPVVFMQSESPEVRSGTRRDEPRSQLVGWNLETENVALIPRLRWLKLSNYFKLLFKFRFP